MEEIDGTQQTYYWVIPNASPSDQGECCDASQPTTPDPVGIGSGNEFIRQTDYRSYDGRLVLTRAFNSGDPTNGFVSPGWQNSYDARRILPEIDTLPAATIDALSGTNTTPASACTAASGTYLNDSQCQLANGQIVPIYSSSGIGAAYAPPGSASLNTHALTVRRPDGGFVPFMCPDSGFGACIGNSDRAQTLVILSSGYYQFTDLDRTIEIYSPGGALQTITWRDGYKQTYAYTPSGFTNSGMLNHITDTFGRTLNFTYNANLGLLQTVTTPDGTIQYGYDTSNRLSTVTYPDGSVRTYQYTAPGNLLYLLTNIIDESNQAYASITYDSQGRAQHSSFAGGVGAASINYNDPANPGVTDALNVQRIYHYTTINGRQKLTSISGQPCNTCDKGQAISYDNAGYFLSLTDWNGNVTSYNYDDTSGLEQSRTEAVGTAQQRTISTTWNTIFRLPSQINEPGRKTTFGYDTSGNLLTKTIQDTATNTSRTWTYSNYTAWGAPQTIDGPRTDVADVTQITYYPIVSGNAKSGQIDTITDALGHVTTIGSYDPSGRPLTITDPNGMLTTLTYSPRGWLASVQAGTELTQYSYYPTGLLQQVTLPNGAYLQYTYNAAHQLTQIKDQLGDKIVYGPDVMGNNTAINLYDPSGNLTQTRTWVYNSLNQLYQEIGAQSQTTTYGFDNSGNLNSVIDPLSHKTINGYDALNRLTQVTDPASGITHYGYNALDQLTGVTDPRTLVTAYAVDALGNTGTQQSPDSGNTSATYDAAGNVLTRTDAKNQTSHYQYDALNRLTQITRADSSVIGFSYDQGTNGIGRLTGMSDLSGSTAWSYDAHGRVLRKTQITNGITLSTVYAYDSSGQLLSQTLPSGAVIGYTWSNGQISTLKLNNAALGSSIVWQPFSGPKSWSFANGESLSRSYDQDGRITATPVESTIGYDNASRITGITLGNRSVLSGSRTYGYDALDRLTGYSATGASIAYGYDANGNRNQQSGEGNASTLSIDGASNRITSILKGSTTAKLSYDVNGSVTADVANVYSYDVSGRLSTANGASYTYNGLGQRVKKVVGTLIVLYVYDESGRLVGEYDGGTGLVINETVWLGSLPVAAIQQSGTYYIHADHLNTPRQIDNAAGQAVWTWDNTTFGVATPNQDPNNTGHPFVYNLRYPGQYYDAESGIFQNNHRDYNPTTGRYLESDPIGLYGGINTYAYVGGNPVSFNDPRGLLLSFQSGGHAGNSIGSFYSALAYLARDPGAAQIIQDLEDSPNIILINTTNEMNSNGFDGDVGDGYSVITWNPDQALCTTGGGTQSPALGLLHELAHADGDPLLTNELQQTPVLGYGNAEEERVITGPETSAANALGEGTRQDHSGSGYPVPTPISR